MSTKTEERIKEILREYYEEKQGRLDKDVNTATMGIYVWGLTTGVVLASTGFWSFFAGMVLGYYISKKNGLLMDKLNSWGTEIINVGYHKLWQGHPDLPDA